MSDEHQIDIPPSFVALFVPPGRVKPTASRAEIAARYELCEDLAQVLTEHARSLLFQLGVTELDVLERCRRGLHTPDSGVDEHEALWVTRRLGELLDWPVDPAWPPLPRR